MGNYSHHHKYHKVIARNDKYKLDEDTSVTGNVSGNDRDTKGHDLDFKVIKGPANGTLDFNTETGAFTYTPNANFYGTDYFKYKAYDEYGKWDWAVVKFKVKDVAEPPAPVAPVAGDDKYYVKETKKLYGNLGANDVDSDGTADGDPVDLTFAIVSGPSEGKLYLNEDTGAFCYKPAKDKDRIDDKVTFTYSITDEQGLTDTATVTICVDDNWGKKHYYHHDDMMM